MNTPNDDAVAESAIRRYLDYLADPSSIIDATKVAELEAEIATTTDLIRRLHLHAALERAKRADGESVRAAFVRNARTYADAHELPVSAFRALGVSDIALAEAGFDLGFGATRARATTPRTAGPRPTKAAPAPRQRAPKVSQSTIREHILAVNGSFTLTDITGDIGGSLGTVNAVVKQLQTDGLVVSEGPDKDHHGRGRAPFRYRVAR